MAERDDYAGNPSGSPLLSHELYVQKSLDGFDLILCSKCRKLAWVDPKVLKGMNWMYELGHSIDHWDRMRGAITIPCPGTWIQIWQTDLHTWAAAKLDDPETEIAEHKWEDMQ